MIEHVGMKTIQVRQLPNNFKLSVKVFIAGTEVKNSMQKSKKLKSDVDKGNKAVEIYEKTNESGFTINRGGKFTV